MVKLKAGWFRNISIAQKLYFAIGIMALLILLELFTLWFTMHSLSAVRGYVGAEGLYSKGQKNATYHLYKYSVEQQEKDYQAFLSYLNVPMGDQIARRELLSSNPRYEVAADGFSQAKVDKKDIDGMIKLFTRFHKVYYIHMAIHYWTQGDSLINELKKTGTALHAHVLEATAGPLYIERIRERIDKQNAELTVLEDNFSYILGEGSRWLENLVLDILIMTAIFVELSGLILSISISRGISRGINEIIGVTNSVAKGDFSRKATIISGDEMGYLAESINNMTTELDQNIRLRQKAEKQLAAANKIFESLIKTAPVAIISVDLDLNVRVWNPAAERIFGYTSAEITGKKLPIVPEDKPDDVDRVIKTLMHESRVINMDAIRRRKDGSEVAVNISLGGLYDDQDKLTGIIGIFTDITERVSAEKRISEYLNELELKNEELNNFAYVVSHDLKAPLRAINTLVNWFTSDYRDLIGEEGLQNLRLLIGRVTRMHSLIDGILEYSRVGKADEHIEPVDLNELVAETITLLAPPSHMVVKIENPLPTVHFDAVRIAQVFQNLIGNAIKFMDNPQGVIRIQAFEEPGFYRFSVCDNGPGIEKEYFSKIFMIFQTLHARDEIESTGIGLTIVKKIIESAGGKIWLESRIGEGSCFYFTIKR